MFTFIGPKYWILFHRICAGFGLLTRLVNTWDQDPELVAVCDFLKGLNIVNNSAERCTNDTTAYRNRLLAQDSDQHSKEILLVVNYHYHVVQDESTVITEYMPSDIFKTYLSSAMSPSIVSFYEYSKLT